LGEPFEHRPQSESAVQAVAPSGHSLEQSVALLHVLTVPTAPPTWHNEYAAHGVDVLEQLLLPYVHYSDDVHFLVGLQAAFEVAHVPDVDAGQSVSAKQEA
jgi:hypothetical protein